MTCGLHITDAGMPDPPLTNERSNMGIKLSLRRVAEILDYEGTATVRSTICRPHNVGTYCLPILIDEVSIQLQRWRQHVSPKRRYPPTRLHRVTIRKPTI
jgi:hypothetical protein